MELVRVGVEPPTNVPVVLLREREGAGRVLPIFIGPPEAQAIALAMDGIETPRPMTHDLLKNVLDELSTVLERIVVTELVDKTFYAELHLVRAGARTTVSSRPSDAIALAVRTGASIHVAEAVLDAAAFTPSEEGEAVEEEQVVEEFREFIENVNPEDFVD